jgi:hypothetical protein
VAREDDAAAAIDAADVVGERDRACVPRGGEEGVAPGDHPALAVRRDVVEEHEPAELDAGLRIRQAPERSRVHGLAVHSDADERVVSPDGGSVEAVPPTGRDVRSGVVVRLHEAAGGRVVGDLGDLVLPRVDGLARRTVDTAPIAPALDDGGDHGCRSRRMAAVRARGRLAWSRMYCRMAWADIPGWARRTASSTISASHRVRSTWTRWESAALIVSRAR